MKISDIPEEKLNEYLGSRVISTVTGEKGTINYIKFDTRHTPDIDIEWDNGNLSKTFHHQLTKVVIYVKKEK